MKKKKTMGDYQSDCLGLAARLVHGRKSEWLPRPGDNRLMKPPCPRCNKNVRIYRSVRGPVFDYICKSCGFVFNVFSGTVFQGTHRTPSELIELVLELVEGGTTSGISRRLGCNRSWLVQIRRKIESTAWIGHLREGGEEARFQVGGILMEDLLEAIRATPRVKIK